MKKLIAGLALFIVMPIMAYSQAPKAMPHGRPLVGMLEQHLYYPNNFIEVDRVWDDRGTLVKYYYNVATLVNDLGNAEITVWFLEEYTDIGREWLLNHYRSIGINTTSLKDLRYHYYQITLAYADVRGNGYEDPFDYEYIILPGGETCDSNKKYLTFVQPVDKFRRIDHKNQMHYVHLASALKNKYNLRQ
jgi:hypothetical protein